MVYREPADELARQAALAVEASGPLALLDVVGRPGPNGEDGPAGRDARGRGADGEDGTPAGPAGEGEAGGSILVVVERDPGRDHIARIHGRVTSWRGSERADHEVDFARRGEIQLVARGGGGGHGGRGGCGGDGARGSSGSDATRYSSGGDGGAGGDGGDGASGSSGARGGVGGRIVVRVRDVDTHLLMLVAQDVSGGAGGQAGANGRAGLGGPGGPGGSSHSWTESESYTDAQGNSQTRTTHHSNSGGSSGPRGRDGGSSSARLVDGARGHEGSFAIEVLDEAARATRYGSRYDVRLVSFRHRNANDDGIYEPEEKVFISQLEVENIGGMPTPAHHEIRVGIVDDGWIAPADVRLVLPRALRPGQRHVFTTEELALTLRVFRPQASAQALAASETIRFYADLPDAKRRFAAFETRASQELGKLVVRFPVEASPLTSLFSLAPGQAARLRWSITNVSEKAHGLKSELGRAVSVFVGLAREPGLDASQIHLFDEHGTRIPLDVGFRRAVPILGPHETITFEETIAIAETAATYTSARLFLAAELGHVDEPHVVRPIQYRELTIRVGRPFESQDADVLFIVNNRTSGEELLAWEELARRVGLSSAVWDASLEGGVGVLSTVAAGTRRYRLVVFLNNTMDTVAGERRPGVLLDKPTSLALARAGVHVCYVGRLPDLDDLVVPIDDAVIDGEASEADAVGGPGTSIEIRASYVWLWSEPNPEHLAARGRSLAARLEKKWPDRRYVVVPRYEVTLEKRVAWVRVYRLGQLIVRRTLDPARASVSGVRVDAKEMHDAAFAQDPRTLAALAAALPFAVKVKLLDDSPLAYGAQRVSEGTACEDGIVAAALTDLVREQTLAARCAWRAPPADLERATPMLAELKRDAFREPIDLTTPRGLRFVELIAWLELVARGHARWWEWIPPLVWLRRGTVLRSFVRDAIAAVLERAAGSEDAAQAVRAAVKARLVHLRGAWKHRRRQYDGPAYARGFALECTTALFGGRPLQVDALCLPPGERVIASDRVDSLREKERGRKGRSNEMLAGAARARADLLREERCAELLTRAGALEIRVGSVGAIATRPAHEEREAFASIEDLAGLREPSS